MRIDVHAHLYPPSYLDMLERFGSSAGVGFVRELGGGSAPGEMSGRLAMMDRASIDLQILSVSSSVPYFANPQQSIDAARCANDAYADIIHRYPGRFAAFAVTPLPHVEAAIAELDRTLSEPGFAGVTTTTEVLGTSIADSRFDQFYAELDSRRAVLFVHPSGSGIHSPAIERERLTWSIGAPFEDLLCLVQLARAKIPQRVPHLRIISAHLGGCASFLMDRLAHHDVVPASRGPQESTLSADDARWFFYDTVNGHPAALKCASDTTGVAGLLMGTDIPYNRGAGHQRMVEYIGQSGLDPKDVAAIYGGNAIRLFGSRLPGYTAQSVPA
jgi:aminocarboxymuconate-semialdehyde decarboxylase